MARLLGQPQPDVQLSSSPTQPRDSRSGSVGDMDQILGPGGRGSPEAGEPREGEDSQERRHRGAAGLEMTNFTTHGGGGDGSMGTASPEPNLLLTLEDGLGGGGGSGIVGSGIGGIGGDGDGGSSMWSKEGSMMREEEPGTGKAASLPRKQQQQQQQQRREGQGSDTWQEGCKLETWLTSQVGATLLGTVERHFAPAAVRECGFQFSLKCPGGMLVPNRTMTWKARILPEALILVANASFLDSSGWVF